MDPTNQWNPNSFERRVVDLQQLHPQMVDRAVKLMHSNPSQNLSSPKSLRASLDMLELEAVPETGPDSKLAGELQDLCTIMTPATYLQVCAARLCYLAHDLPP